MMLAGRSSSTRAQWPVLLAALLSCGGMTHHAAAELPLPTYPDCGADGTTQNCPPDLTKSDGNLTGDAWAFLNFIPESMKTVRKQELAMGSGTWSTAAWRTTTGRFDTKIAVLDCGIRWHKDSIKNKVALNADELPPPLDATGAQCADYDCDHNGLVNVMDYADDYRVDISAGQNVADDKLDPSDLIATFSDGADDDGDGYVDNIAGWDFFWDDNEPYTTNDFYHMTYVLEDGAAEGGQMDSAIGHCPNCSILPVRISDSFVGEGDKIAQGIIFAVDSGADIIGMALGSMSNPDLLQSAMQYAWDNDVTIIAAAGDELGYHHNYPGANEHALYVHSIKFFPPISFEKAHSTLGYYGCNNFGARLDLVAPSGGCATGSVAATIGVAGLVVSRARDLGISLSAPELRQLLIRNVDDINVNESQLPGSPYFPSHVGWDLFFGYGRVNAYNSVNALDEGAIPPEIDFDQPQWFDYVDPRVSSEIRISGRIDAPRADSYGYSVSWAPGVDPKDQDFTLIDQASNLNAPMSGDLAVLYLNSIDPEKLDALAPMEPLDGNQTLEEKNGQINARGITVKIRVTDNRGNVAEEKKQVFLIEDNDLLPNFPVKLGHSGEASPTLYDLNGDGAKEIILATSNGEVHAYTSSGSELSGWPVQVGLLKGVDPTNTENHLDSNAYTSEGVDSEAYQGIVGKPAVGDLEGDGVADVIAGTLEGSLWAFDASGALKNGFPVHRDPVSDADTNPQFWFDPGMFSSTVLYDLDDDGALEIIQASMDQKIYVWRWDGSAQPGFPVVLENPDGSTGVTTIAGRIVSSPAVGDLDGDGEPEIVVGSNEYDDEEPYIGYVYAIHGQGNESPRGAVVPGWPVELPGLLGGVINYIGEGTTPSPSLADIDGDGQLEVVISGVASYPTILGHDGRTEQTLAGSSSDFGANTNTTDAAFWAVISNIAVADFDADGDLDALLPGSGINFFVSLGVSRYLKFDHLAAVYDIGSGKMLDAFPRVTEDISFFNSPAAGDITGDGIPEMLTGTSGYVLHGFTRDGSQPDGWPKFTGGWLIASPAVGDIDGDGKNEVVQPTREGFLFAWNTEGVGGLEWPSFRHDPQNTGNYHVVGE